VTDLWVSERDDPDDDLAWETPINLGCAINKGDEDSPVYFRDRESDGQPLLHKI
jgi:hypothetical protein